MFCFDDLWSLVLTLNLFNISVGVISALCSFLGILFAVADEAKRALRPGSFRYNKL